MMSPMTMMPASAGVEEVAPMMQPLPPELQRVRMVGIGGAGMSRMTHILLDRGGQDVWVGRQGVARRARAAARGAQSGRPRCLERCGAAAAFGSSSCFGSPGVRGWSPLSGRPSPALPNGLDRTSRQTMPDPTTLCRAAARLCEAVDTNSGRPSVTLPPDAPATRGAKKVQLAPLERVPSRPDVVARSS